MIDMIEIAKKISEEMARNNLSYAELSKLTGISKSTLQRYVTGETGKMPIPSLEIIAKALHVSPSYLIGWEDPKEVDQIDDELEALLVQLSNREDLRILFKLASDASPEDVRVAAALIENLRGRYEE